MIELQVERRSDLQALTLCCLLFGIWGISATVLLVRNTLKRVYDGDYSLYESKMVSLKSNLLSKFILITYPYNLGLFCPFNSRDFLNFISHNASDCPGWGQ